jgi:peptidoglycan-associated lipoprotein
MRNQRWVPVLTGTLIVMMLGACGPKRPPATATDKGRNGGRPGSTTGRGTDTLGTGPDVRPLGDDATRGQDLLGGTASPEGGPLGDVYFDLDQYNVSEAARAILDKNAQWLQAHLDTRVKVEGHCDERGTVEYNLALGEQRAKAAKDYLVQLGVAADRLGTVSYGKERPIDPGHDDVAMAKNRRVHFAVSN